MKRNLIAFCLFLLIAGLASAQAAKGGTMYVAVKSVELKASTGFFAGTNGQLNYGDSVTVLQVSGKFMEVKSSSNSSLTGWTATSNLSARQVVAGTSSSATAKEVALAGKGFNQEVESSYKEQGNLNYDAVDRVEAISVNIESLKKFLEEGRLSMGE